MIFIPDNDNKTKYISKLKEHSRKYYNIESYDIIIQT
jgi:hypothetical protein